MIKTLMCAALSVAALVACTTGKAAYGPQPVSLSQDHMEALLGSSVSTNGQHSFGDNLLVSMAQFARTNADDAEAVRNMKHEVIGLLMGQSETICSAYLTDIFGVRNTTDTSLSIASLAFNTASGLMPSAGSTGSILSNLSTMTTSSHKILERSFFGDSDLAIVAQSIRADRTKRRLELTKLLNSTETQDLPFGLLYAHVQEYHDACGINQGIDNLKTTAQDAVETKNEENEEKLDALTN